MSVEDYCWIRKLDNLIRGLVTNYDIPTTVLSAFGYDTTLELFDSCIKEHWNMSGCELYGSWYLPLSRV